MYTLAYMKTIITFISLLIYVSNVEAQQCDKIFVSGKVIDSLRPQAFYNLMVINKRTGQGVFGQPNGIFSTYILDRDTIILSVKEYEPVYFVVKADSNCQFKIVSPIFRLAKELREVVIHPLKTLEQIKEERSSLSMRETRMVTGIEMMQSPITALYQAFSKKESNKRWVAKQQFKDNERKVVQELLRLYVAYDIINLTEDEFDDFIAFLNINDEFLKTATEMELITFIQDKYEHFIGVK
jgi:hypothetical protein